MRAAFLLVLSACLDQPEPGCRTGFTRAPDGHCYPPPSDPEPPSATDVIDALPPCESLPVDGLVDIDGGCVAGACAGATFPSVDAALGGGASCETAGWSEDWVYCEWPSAVEGLFPDLDHDGIGDADGTTDWIHLKPGCPHSTDEGLGVGISPRCWVDVLGVPSTAVWIDAGGELFLRDLAWDGYGLEVHDWDGAPDGVVDDAYVFGAP